MRMQSKLFYSESLHEVGGDDKICEYIIQMKIVIHSAIQARDIHSGFIEFPSIQQSRPVSRQHNHSSSA